MALHFDADALTQALDPPTFKVGGEVFTGRMLSIEQWWRLESRLDALRRGQLNYAQTKVLFRDLTDALFPPPPQPSLWRRLLLGARRERSVADRLAELPMPVQMKAVTGFIDSQVNALSAALEQPEPGE